MTPRVPSLPTNSWVRSGPARGPRRLPAGADHPPIGQRHFQAGDHVLDLPVTRRILARSPAGHPTADGRQLRATAASARASGRDCLAASPPGCPHRCRPARRRATTCHRHSTSPSRPRMSSETPPNTGTQAPHTPLRPANAVRGRRNSWQAWRHRGHLGRGGRPGDRGGPGWHFGGGRPGGGQGPPVPTRLDSSLFAGVNVGADVLEAGDGGVVHFDLAIQSEWAGWRRRRRPGWAPAGVGPGSRGRGGAG